MSIVVIIYYDFVFTYNKTLNDVEYKLFNPARYPVFIGLAILNFEGNTGALNIYASMKHQQHFFCVTLSTIILIVSLCCFVAAMSYSTFGQYTRDVITLNLPHNELTTFLKLSYCFGLLFTYPIQLFPAMDLIEKLSWYDKLPNLRGYPIVSPIPQSHPNIG